MKTLFQTANSQEIKERLARLKPDAHPQWGKMNSSQMLAHCSLAIEVALGEKPSPPRAFIGRLLGPIVKKMLIIDGKPMRRNSPTDKTYIVADQRDFVVEQKQLNECIDRFVKNGQTQCTKRSHVFFGPLTPDEWSSLMYQHLDHHLRQFGV